MARSSGKISANLKFEQAMQQLEEIVRSLEEGHAPLEEAVGQFEQAMVLAAHCERVLAEIEQRIQQIQIRAAGEGFDLIAPNVVPQSPAMPPEPDADP